jgi:hypothetical protein
MWASARHGREFGEDNATRICRSGGGVRHLRIGRSFQNQRANGSISQGITVARIVQRERERERERESERESTILDAILGSVNVGALPLAVSIVVPQ